MQSINENEMIRYKIETNSNLKLKNGKTIIELFNSEENQKQLTFLILQKIKYNTYNKHNKVLNLVKQYITSWINLGKFESIQNKLFYEISTQDLSGSVFESRQSSSRMILVYYNNIFVDKFSEVISHKIQNSGNNNIFQNTINGKSVSDFTVEDYRNLNVKSEEPKFNFYKKTKIPFYRKTMNVRNYDNNDIGGLKQSEINLNYKKYNMSDLKNIN